MKYGVAIAFDDLEDAEKMKRRLTGVIDEKCSEYTELKFQVQDLSDDKSDLFALCASFQSDQEVVVETSELLAIRSSVNKLKEITI